MKNRSFIYASLSTIFLIITYMFEYKIIKDVFKYNLSKNALIHTTAALAYSTLLITTLVLILIDYIVDKKYKAKTKKISKTIFTTFTIISVFFIAILLKSAPSIQTVAFFNFLAFLLKYLTYLLVPLARLTNNSKVRKASYNLCKIFIITSFILFIRLHITNISISLIGYFIRLYVTLIAMYFVCRFALTKRE